MQVRSIILSFLSLTVALTTSVAQSDVKLTKDKLAKWVETRQIISEEAADWEVEQETMTATRDLLQLDLANIQDKIDELDTTNTEEDKTKRELDLKRVALENAQDAITAKVTEMEKSVKALIGFFPSPLLDKVEQILIRIPENPEETDALTSARLQNILFILGQADKFNSTITLTSETREVGGKKIQVQVIYWGLSRAYYIDANKTTAGIGEPSASGWKWTAMDDLVGPVSELVSLYEGTTDPKFVTLPVSSK